MVGFVMASADQPAEIYKAGLNTTRLLMALGDLVIGWLLLRHAEIALNAGSLRMPPIGPRSRLLHGQARRGAGSSPPPCCPGWPPSASSSRRPRWT